eukprot:TRINITY_DN128_c0_g1_i5.p3 TRINITY_DN128_c0_g1~~TRINITY_DN128_c0_g1_i5.p3  ORF type:complete len:181 (+),score=25.18 TRINITY_DN128_c0_g1_i5:142-684(+)
MLAVSSSQLLSNKFACNFPRHSRQQVKAQAIFENVDRRNIIGGLMFGVLSSTTKAALAVTNVDLFDDRKALDKGFDIIYEARDLDLPQGVRDGMTQMKGNIKETLARASASGDQLKTEVGTYIKKQYWTEASNALRRQVGTLRFDLNTLASSKTDKTARKEATAAIKDFIKNVEDLADQS